MRFFNTLQQAHQRKEISDKIFENFKSLYESYSSSIVLSALRMEDYDHLFEEMFALVKEQVDSPHRFDSYHQKVLQPVDYFRFGVEFVRPLVDPAKSCVHNQHNLDRIVSQLNLKENVIFFANHQTEVDPQIISLALEKTHPLIAKEIIFVAGDRVLTDPLAIPFSLGRNLLCIYSKRHIDNPPEQKAEKLKANQKTMKVMKEMLSEGGKCIYMAPSGGRDRPRENGEVVVAPFDPQSIEMFRLMAIQAKSPVHFYPLSLVTFDILPPPQSIEKELGEKRIAKREGALLSFGDEIDMENFPDAEQGDRHAQRSARALYIWNLVTKNYYYLKEKKGS